MSTTKAVKSLFKVLKNDIQSLNESVSKLVDQVNKFSAFEFNSVTESAVVEFVKMSNFLLAEFKFLYNGKHSASQRSGLYYDLLTERLNKLEGYPNKRQSQLDLMDNYLKIISSELFSCIKKIREKINDFRNFISTLEKVTITYTTHDLENSLDVSNYFAKSVTYESKVNYLIPEEISNFDCDTCLTNHPWRGHHESKKRKRLLNIDNQGKKSKKSQDPVDKQKKYEHVVSDDDNAVVNERKSTKHSKQHNTSSIVNSVSNLPTGEIAHQPLKRDKTTSVQKFIADFNFDNVDILVKSNFQDNEKKLSLAATQLFRDEKCNEERRRAFIFQIISIYSAMKISFLEFFILLERSIQRIKKEEMDLLRSDGFTTKNDQEKLRDSLQRKARKFVGSYGKTIFDFLREFKSCETIVEKTLLFKNLWPLSDLTDEFLWNMSTTMTTTVNMLYSEDHLLVGLSAEGFQSFRNELYSAIQDDTVCQLFSSNEKDKCIEHIRSLVHTSQDRFSKTSFVENLWNLVCEYHHSTLPKAGSRSLPWELRHQKTRNLEEMDSITTKDKRRRRSKKEPNVFGAGGTVESTSLETTDEVISRTENPNRAATTCFESEANYFVDEDISSSDKKLPLIKMHGDSSADQLPLIKINGDTSADQLPLSMHGDTSAHQLPLIKIHGDTSVHQLPLSMQGDTSADHQLPSIVVKRLSLSNEDTSAFLVVDNATKDDCKSDEIVLSKQVPDDFNYESDDDILECEVFDETDLVVNSSNVAGSVEELLDVLFQHLSIEEIWENIDDIWASQKTVDLTGEAEAVNTVTPAPNKSSSVCNRALNLSGIETKSINTQLNFISPSNTPNGYGVDVFRKTIDHLSVDFKNRFSEKANYCFYWNLEQDLAKAVANNFEEFFESDEYISLLTFFNLTPWSLPLTFFHCIFCIGNDYVLAYMDSKSFCLHIWANANDDRIQSLYDNIRALLSAIGTAREFTISKNSYQVDEFSESTLFFIFLHHLNTIREGKSVNEMPFFEPLWAESKREKLIDMVHAVKLPTIDVFFELLF
jgi:hypothetical protein